MRRPITAALGLALLGVSLLPSAVTANSGSYRLWVNKCTTCDWEAIGIYRSESDCRSAATKLPNWYFWECNPA